MDLQLQAVRDDEWARTRERNIWASAQQADPQAEFPFIMEAESLICVAYIQR